MNAAEVLRAAKEKISDPARWCQGMHAKNALGYAVDSRCSRAVSWCAVGALTAVGALLTDPARTFLDRAAEEIMPGYAPQGVNDSKGHADVMAMFDRAIALAEES